MSGFRIGEMAEFIDEEGEEIHLVTIEAITSPEPGSKHPYAFVIVTAGGETWVVDPSELGPLLQDTY